MGWAGLGWAGLGRAGPGRRMGQGRPVSHVATSGPSGGNGLFLATLRVPLAEGRRVLKIRRPLEGEATINKRTLFVHIGYPKTGSSYIQILLGANEATLRQHGLRFPEIVDARVLTQRWGQEHAGLS